MQLTEDEINKKYAKRCGHCNRSTFLPNEYEFTCFSCGYNVIKRKHELPKIQRKRRNFINRLKYAEHKIFCICVVVYKKYEGGLYDKLYKVLSTLKKLKLNYIVIEKYKKILTSNKISIQEQH